MKKIIFILFIIINSYNFAQVVITNNGQNIIMKDGAQFFVKGGDFSNNSGIVNNENGHIVVEGSYINNDETIGGNSNSEFRIEEDWENNATFNANETTVILNGDDQTIHGTEESHFFNLHFENGNIKTLQINSTVSGILDLDNSELATLNNKMTVVNTDADAIDFVENSGFVSSTNDGRLVRNTNSTDSYIFPVGEDDGTLTYRPILIEPEDVTNGQFEVRFVKTNADLSGYDFSLKTQDVENLNDQYFHYINRVFGSEKSKLSILYMPDEDGEWDGIAQWNSKWKTLADTESDVLSSFKEIRFNEWVSDNNEPHILITKDDPAKEFAMPNIFSPNSNILENQVFTIINQHDLVEVETLEIYDRWGYKVYDYVVQGFDYWDGFNEGILQSPGNYVYLVRVKNKEGVLSDFYSGNFLMVW